MNFAAVVLSVTIATARLPAPPQPYAKVVHVSKTIGRKHYAYVLVIGRNQSILRADPEIAHVMGFTWPQLKSRLDAEYWVVVEFSFVPWPPPR